MPSITTGVSRCTRVRSVQVSMCGVTASYVSASSARRNSRALSENTTPKPNVESAAFCSTRRSWQRGFLFLNR
jgi:hypothetical protein